MRVLIVDDHEVVRRGIRGLLSTHPAFEICGEASDGREAVAKAQELLPDFITLDITMPRLDGLQAARVIRRELPKTKIVLISQNESAIVRRFADEVSADGYLAKVDVGRALVPLLETLAGLPHSAAPATARSSRANSFGWLAGNGEMANFIRSKDWESTPLGAVESWSPTLRTMVSFLVAQRFPHLLWWGSQFCCIYNDAYAPILGAKHPHALGAPCEHVWHEIWHILQPLIETPFRGGPATWMEDIPLEINRRGFFEETHFTIAYSPVPDETAPAGIGGVIATVHEITEKVVGERRTLILRDLGVRSEDPKSAEEACEIATETLSRNLKDIPFVLIYLLESKQESARLICGAGADLADAGCRETLDVSSGQGDAVWPIFTALQTEEIQLVQDLAAKFERVPPGPFIDPPDRAAVVPIRSSLSHQPVGFLIAGVSSRLEFNESYRNFLELVAGQISATIGKARAYEEERRRSEALAEIDRAKTAFFSNISHEFRTPLTLMLAPLEDLLAGGHVSDAARNQLALISRNGTRLLRLVNTLLDFSRIEAGRVEAVYEPTDLGALTSDLASVFRSATERAGLQLFIDCRISDPVYVDRDMWEKIVLNLVSNAFKFTFEGSISVSLRQFGNSVEMRVADTGVGIPPEEVPRLFERFHRVNNSRSRTNEGTGIGLALVHELVKLHGGTIRAESIVGRGTTFIITVPLGNGHLAQDRIGAARTASSTAIGASPFVDEAIRWLPDDLLAVPNANLDPSRELLRPFPSAHDSSSRPTLLIADDNADMRQYLHRLLSERYEVALVPDGEAALLAIDRRKPDLILSDVMMPSLDGFALLERIRSNPATRTIPIVLLSARAGEESRLQGLQHGADDYLVKPFSARELLARIESHISLARVRRESEAALRENETQLRKAHAELEQKVLERTQELLQASENLRELSVSLLQAQDVERRRIARELHDSVGQLTAAIAMNISTVSHEAHKLSPIAASCIAENKVLVEQLTKDIRTISYLLHPPLLDEVGFKSAVTEYVRGFAERSKIAVTLDIPALGERLPRDTELSLFRVVQECLTNIHRHSGSPSAGVRLLQSAQGLSLEISDQGRGLPAELQQRLVAGQNPGVGLRGMRERVRQLGGDLRIDSGSSGTTVRVDLPVRSLASPTDPLASNVSSESAVAQTSGPSRPVRLAVH